ncbi:MAG: BatD family protein [Saprospiraceae bacterium]|nr:BatD family protein [Saprospiraceae bacterium]
MKRLFFLPVLLLTITVYGQQPVVKVEVSSDTVSIGERVEVTYTIENGEGKLNMPDMSKLPVISGPNTSSSFMYQNGKMSSNQSYSFTLMAMEAGTLIVPKATYQTGEEKLTIRPVEVVVLATPGSPSSSRSASEKSSSTTTREKRKF